MDAEAAFVNSTGINTQEHTLCFLEIYIQSSGVSAAIEWPPVYARAPSPWYVSSFDNSYPSRSKAFVFPGKLVVLNTFTYSLAIYNSFGDSDHCLWEGGSMASFC